MTPHPLNWLVLVAALAACNNAEHGAAVEQLIAASASKLQEATSALQPPQPVRTLNAGIADTPAALTTSTPAPQKVTRSGRSEGFTEKQISTSPKSNSETQAPATIATLPSPTVRGPAAAAETFTTWLETVGTYSAGKPGEVRVVLEAKPPYKCNKEYPYRFTFGAPQGGVSYPSAIVHDMKVAGSSASMVLPLLPSGPGKALIQGTLNFSVCTDETCLVEKRTLSVSIEIN